MMCRAVFLDRDGVINKAIIRNGNAFSPRTKAEFSFIDGVLEAIARLKDAGFRVIIITNQPDISRKKMDPQDLAWMTEQILKQLPVDEIIICPHDDKDCCNCRKPKAGMLLDSAKKWDIDLKQSYMIGDSWKDMDAGETAGCTCILIDAPYNQDVYCLTRAGYLADAVQMILGHKG